MKIVSDAMSRSAWIFKGLTIVTDRGLKKRSLKVIGRAENDRCDCREIQNAVHLRRCLLVGNGKEATEGLGRPRLVQGGGTLVRRRQISLCEIFSFLMSRGRRRGSRDSLCGGTTCM